MRAKPPDLARTQAWLQAVLLHPGAPQEALDAVSWNASRNGVRALVRPSPTLAPEERVEIYRDMVRARFAQALGHQFPAVRRRLGDSFTDIAAAYVAAHPSRSPTLADLGSRFALFLEGRREPGFADLARLEWAIHRASDLPGARALAPEDLADVPAGAWAGARLVPVPSLRLVPLTHDAAAVWAGDGAPRPRRCTVAVWRAGDTVRHAALGARAARLLERLAGGAPLGEAVRDLRPAAVRRWLAAWTADGIFRAVETAGAPPASEKPFPRSR